MKEFLSFFIWGNGKDTSKKSVVWNMVFSVLSAMQSVLLVMTASRLAGPEEAGMVSIAFAAGYLIWTVAAFGVRNFQATDVKSRFAFQDYLSVRIATCVGALFMAGIYILYQGYTDIKMYCVLGISLFKVTEAFEDLYFGELQRTGRLDAAGRLGSARLLVNYITFFCILLSGGGFTEAVFIMAGQSVIAVLLEYFLLGSTLHTRHIEFRLEKGRQIFGACFPLFLMGFLNIYVINSPRYAIDRYMSENVQAYFAALYAPVFGINLLGSIIYQPQMAGLARLWNKGGGNTKEFLTAVRKQVAVILAITVLAVAAGVGVGLRILGVMYGLPLENFVCEFAMLLAGGGMAAVYNFLSVCLTVMRKQMLVMRISVLAALEALAVSEKLVMHAGLIGAAVLYLLLMLGEVTAAAVVIEKNMKRRIS